MNNSLYNLKDNWKERDGSEGLWVSFETFFIQRLNFCDFAFIWERGEFDEKIINPSYRFTKCIRVVFKKALFVLNFFNIFRIDTELTFSNVSFFSRKLIPL